MLISNLDLLATAPGGVARLRELILTLAVQGKLVPQNPSDEPASELLKKIRAEKDRLIAQGKIKREKLCADTAEDEKPFVVPNGWIWVKGRDLFTVIRGVTYQKTDARDTPIETHLPILRANNIRGSVNLDDLVYVPVSLVSADQILRSGDYVVCLASGSKNLVGKAAPFRESIDCSFGAFCGAIRPIQEAAYFSVYLASPMYRDSVSEASAGIGINNLKGSSLLDLDLALPPLAEQSRIVTRVEELMRLCDALEAKGQLESTQHAQLVSTLLGTLTESETPEELAENWQRIATHFDLLLDRPEAVDALEQTILQLAVRGLLAPQDPQDEPASELLKKIRVEKDKLIAEGKIKRDKTLPPIAEEDQPFNLPQGWGWARFPELGEFGRGKSKHRPRNDPSLFNPPKYPLIQTGEVSRAKGVVQEVHSYYSDIGLAQSRMWPKGTLCITIAANIAESAILGFDSCFPDSVVGFVPADAMGNVEYFLLFVETAKADLLAFAPATAQKNINLEILSSLLIPLPPLTELTRIVARVASLRALCANLRKCLTTTSNQQSLLAEVLVAGEA